MASLDFIEECKNDAYANRLGKIIVEDLEEDITEEKNLQSLSIDNSCIVDNSIIGSIYIKKLSAQLLDSNELDLIDKSLEVEIGVKYEDTTTEYIKMGKYTIERPNNEQTANMSQITAYDDFINKLDSEYVCGIDFDEQIDVTVEDFYIDVCNNLNLTPSTTNFDNNDILINNNPFTNGEKNRTVLQTIGKISGNWFEIDTDTNEIELCWLSQSNDPDYTFTKDDYSTLEGGQITYGPINSLIIKNSEIDDENVTIQDTASIEEFGEHSIIINEDYILYSEELRQQAITALWNKLHGLTYTDCKLTTYYGKPFLKLGDKLRIYTDDIEYFDTYLLKHLFTYDGTFQSVIESPALTEQEIKTKQDISLSQRLKNTEIKVNKQDGVIESVVTKTNELSDDVVELGTTVTQNTEQLTVSIQKLNDKVDANITDGVESLKNSLVTIDINGISVSTNLSKVSTIMTNDTFAIKDNTDTYLAYFGYDEIEGCSKAEMDNLTINNYFTAGLHRQEKIEGENRTGWFYVGGVS